MRRAAILQFVVVAMLAATPALADDTPVKDLGRFLGWRDNALVGYGIVTGLSGSGDSPRSQVTRQALQNVLGRLGVTVSPDQLQSRNVAAVIVTATLPASAHVGDRIDATVSSIGDARSLAGGTLLMTPLLGPDRHDYALAQGSLVVNGYRFDANLNREQKNYPTAGVLPMGATVEQGVQSSLIDPNNRMKFILREPDATTAARIADAINRSLGGNIAWVEGPEAVAIDASAAKADPYRFVARIESLTVEPAAIARVVVNQRSGTVVAGAGVRISPVVISQGDVKVSVTVDNQASQPLVVGGRPGDDVRSLIVTNTKLAVETPEHAVVVFPNTTVGDLVKGLAKVHIGAAGTIDVLQALQKAGALHAEIVVQ